MYLYMLAICVYISIYIVTVTVLIEYTFVTSIIIIIKDNEPLLRKFLKGIPMK